MNILGIGAYYHDSAACLVRDGELIAAAQEERFTRRKHDPGFPEHAIRYCLREARIAPSDIDHIAYYEKPMLKFERILETYLQYAPRGLRSFTQSMPIWVKEKLLLGRLLNAELNRTFDIECNTGKRLDWEKRLFFPEHHLSHAASAFYASPFERAAILTLDGVGEWATATGGIGEGSMIDLLWEVRFPHSLGLLYSAFTYYIGFKVNSGEYKVMGLAPYGEPRYVDLICTHLIDLKQDGSFRLNMKYFDYCVGMKMTNDNFNQLFGGPPRSPESALTQKEMDLARSVQEVANKVMLRMARHVKRETRMDHLCLSGGVALNCVANGKIQKEGIFKEIWIQPAAGDAGGAIGAALAVWHAHFGNQRQADNKHDRMKGSFLGPAYTQAEIEQYLKDSSIPFNILSNEELSSHVAGLIADGAVIGWFQGRMEFGPRALGGRSIIGDARSRTMHSVMNQKIKFRESFRPLAPSVIAERASSYFDLDCPSPYMLLVASVVEHQRIAKSEITEGLRSIDLLNVARSRVPAVTHVDYSARIQTVHQETNPKYYDLIKKFEEKTGCPMIVNTSFNVRGEPLVANPQDAYRCFMRTAMDYLILENCILDKKEQPLFREDKDWRNEFAFD